MWLPWINDGVYKELCGMLLFSVVEGATHFVVAMEK